MKKENAWRCAVLWILSVSCTLVLLLAAPSQAHAIGIGDCISFGSYEQDNDLFNGKEPIEWIILKSDGHDFLLLSRYALDCQPYNDTYERSITWQECSLRNWLNTTFYNTAFSTEEKRSITPHTVWNTVGSSTADYVFLMSCAEASEMFENQTDRIATITEYTRAQGANDLGGGRSWYWLRDRGSAADCACYVNSSGVICGSPKGMDAITKHGTIRPLIWVRVDSLRK